MIEKKLIKSVSQNTNISEKQTAEILNAFFDVFMDEVAKEKIKLPFGTFEVSVRKARTGRNPQTGTSIAIPESKVLKLRVSKAFKEDLNK